MCAMSLACILLLLSAYLLGQVDSKKEQETRLLNDLLQGYDNRVKPDGINNKTFHLYSDMGIFQIIDVDEKNQVLHGLYWQLQQWTDTELSWDPANYSDTTEVYLTDDKIWHPNMGLINEVDIRVSLQSSQTTRLSVHYSGFVTRSRLVYYVSSCTMNLRRFPFDTQNCTHSFTSYRYYAHQMNVTTTMPFSEDHINYENSEFNLKDVETLTVAEDRCCGLAVIVLHYHIILERRPLFFMLNLMLPSSLITMVAMLSFCIPPDSGEKVGLGVTVLLSLSVFLMIINEEMSPTAEVPFIAIFFFGAVVLVTLSTAVTMLVLSIHHSASDQQAKGIPQCLKRVCYGKLPQLLCVTPIADVWKHGTKVVPIERQIGRVSPNVNNNDESKLLQTELKPVNHSVSIRLASCLATLEEYLRHKKELKEQDEQQEKTQQEWRKLAQILDRTFFILFFSFSILFTLGIFLQANYD